MSHRIYCGSTLFRYTRVASKRKCITILGPHHLHWRDAEEENRRSAHCSYRIFIATLWCRQRAVTSADTPATGASLRLLLLLQWLYSPARQGDANCQRVRTRAAIKHLRCRISPAIFSRPTRDGDLFFDKPYSEKTSLDDFFTLNKINLWFHCITTKQPNSP